MNKLEVLKRSFEEVLHVFILFKSLIKNKFWRTKFCFKLFIDKIHYIFQSLKNCYKIKQNDNIKNFYIIFIICNDIITKLYFNSTSNSK